MSDITILCARKILTMNSYRPEATHVAICDGRILGVGAAAELSGWGEGRVDHRFADKVLMPGFVEGHCHAKEGGVWDHLYVGYLDRRDPDGRLWPGADSMEKVIGRLHAIEQGMGDADAPLFAWGFDPIYFGGIRMRLANIDRVSTTRPIVVMHSNGHVLNVNSVVLTRAGISAATNVHGVVKDGQGNPTGELAETAAKYMAYRVTGDPFFAGIRERDLVRFGQAAANCGVTTATDLFATFSDKKPRCLPRGGRPAWLSARCLNQIVLSTLALEVDHDLGLGRLAHIDNGAALQKGGRQQGATFNAHLPDPPDWPRRPPAATAPTP